MQINNPALEYIMNTSTNLQEVVSDTSKVVEIFIYRDDYLTFIQGEDEEKRYFRKLYNRTTSKGNRRERNKNCSKK